MLTGGQALEDIDRLRNDVTFLDAVGARRLPDPTTAGDFLRRFTPEDVTALMEAQNDARLCVWKAQPSRFRAQAVIDVDGTIVPTTGKKKEGADFAYNGTYGYGPLVISLANTNEVLYTVNRAANRPSHDGLSATPWIERAVELVTAGGFRRILLRGDTDFSLTTHSRRGMTRVCSSSSAGRQSRVRAPGRRPGRSGLDHARPAGEVCGHDRAQIDAAGLQGHRDPDASL